MGRISIESAKTVLEVAELAFKTVEFSHNHHLPHKNDDVKKPSELEGLRMENEKLRALLQENVKLLQNISESPCLLQDCPPDEQAAILREVVEQGKSQNPLNNSLDSACKRIVQLNSRQYKWLHAFDNHDICVLDFINDVNACAKSKSVKKSSKRKVWNQHERITTTAEVPLRKPTALETTTPKHVVTLVYSRKHRKSKTMSSKLFSGTVKFGNDHVEKILGYGDYQIGNVTISRVYYMKGLGHNLSLLGQFCESNLEVAFRQHTCSYQENHDLDVAHMNNDLFFGIRILENVSEASSSSDVIPTIQHTTAPNSEHVTKWTKDHHLDNIISELERPVSTRLQLHEQALFCYYNAFLTSVEPKNYKDALTQAC
ncbi:hypothetical protein Tco_0400542 [Tanacetum coccineum]